MDSGPNKKHDFNIIWHESSLRNNNEIDSGPCRKHDFDILRHEFSLGSTKEMDPDPCKNYIDFYLISHESIASGMTMKCFRGLVKNTMLTYSLA